MTLAHKPIQSAAGEIRLLELLPAEEHAPLQGRLEIASLPTNLDFTAISYTWGTSKSPQSINLDGALFCVWENAASVLRRLRYRSQPRKIWIDAVCINQQDHIEKEQQVLLMQQIYSQAQQVYVWLGQEISHLAEPDPWWTRVWVIQEAVLAKKLIFACGRQEASWESVEKAIKTLSKEPDVIEIFGAKIPNDMFRAVSSLRQRVSHQMTASIHETLYRFRQQGCRNPRDRIYGFLGIFPGILHLGVVPTYASDIDTAHIYADLARKTIQNTGSLEILNYVRARVATSDGPEQQEEGPDHLPSWTPNWARWSAYDPAPLLDWSEIKSRYSAASSLMKAHTQDNGDPKTLILGGIRFDEVAELGTTWHPGAQHPPISRKGIRALEQWEDMALVTPISCPYGGPDGRREALWRTYIADSAGEDSAPKHSWALAECWYDRVGWTSSKNYLSEEVGHSVATRVKREPAWAKHMMQLLAETRSTRSPFRAIKYSLEFTIHGAAEYELYAHRVFTVCAHRRLLLSKRGYIGLAPWNAEVGDVIVVLHGGKTPFLLRPGAAPGLYSFVGECFVYGIMGGEALTWEHAIAAARDFRIV